MVKLVKEMVYLNGHFRVLWEFMGNKVSVSFLQQLDIKN